MFTDHSSVEETDNFASDMSLSALFMSEDALSGREHQMSELSGGQDVACPLFELREEDIVSG